MPAESESLGRTHEPQAAKPRQPIANWKPNSEEYVVQVGPWETSVN